jgi:hypothetical protein
VVLIHRYGLAVSDPSGVSYDVRAYGIQRPDGLWEGWLAFVPGEGRAILQTAPETSQSSREDLARWAAGLAPAYFDGAYRRARRFGENATAAA